MGLLNPLNLVYLASLGALVLIYLRFRSRPTLEVSSLMLFEEVAAPVASARILRVDLLFWLQMFALGALSMASVGLYLRIPAAPEHIRRHALVFDLAAATGARERGGTRLQRAQREALQLVGDAPTGDAFSVIGYALEARVMRAQSANRRSISDAILALKTQAVPSRPSALSAALMRARDADTVELYADRLPSAGVLAGAALSGRLHFHQVGSAADNLAIASLDPGTPRLSPGHCVVRNLSPHPHLCELEVDCEHERVLRTTVMLEPRGQLVVPFGPITHGGLLSARIVGDDALESDNQRWAYAQSEAPDRVLLISPDAGVRDDLARVLLAVNQSFIIKAIDPAAFNAGQPNQQFSLAVMHDFYDSRVNGASRLLVYPPLSARPGSAPAEFAVKAALAPAELRDRGGEGVLSRPLLLGSARVLALPNWMDVIGGGAAGGASIALAAFGRDQRGPIGAIAFDIRGHLLLDPDRLDALILTVDLVKQLVAREDVQVVRTGSYAVLPASGTAHIVSPSGATQTARADNYGRIRFRALEAGRFTIDSPGRSVELYANYFDAAESDLEIPSPARADSAPAATGAATFTTPAEIQPLDAMLVMLALAAFLTESAIVLRNAAGWRWRRV